MIHILVIKKPKLGEAKSLVSQEVLKLVYHMRMGAFVFNPLHTAVSQLRLWLSCSLIYPMLVVSRTGLLDLEIHT